MEPRKRRPSAGKIMEIVADTIDILKELGQLKPNTPDQRIALAEVITARIQLSSAPVDDKERAEAEGRAQADARKRKRLEALRRNGPKIVVAVEDSVTDDLIYCLFDRVGRKMISRHILSKYNMTWLQYLEYCDLPPDYPRVAPKYSDQVSGKMSKVMTKKPATGEEARKRREKALETKRNKLLGHPDFGLSAKGQKDGVRRASEQDVAE